MSPNHHVISEREERGGGERKVRKSGKEGKGERETGECGKVEEVWKYI